MTATLCTPTAKPRHSRGTGLVSFLKLVVETRRQRKELARMDEAMLNDIGLTHGDVMHELSRPAWDVPAFWRR